ncbi:MAG: glycosyltransferase [Candidatus Moranbacteria bacterium]|nr:glycosyltransferase [Candidatus Moranbacteria bacterium]
MEEQNKPYLSVIIPAYNEGSRKGEDLKKNLEEIGLHLREKGVSYEVIVVNDGSKDDTTEFVRGLSGLVTKLEVIDRKENRGKWYSVREGLLKANGKFRLMTDADGATSIINLENFWREMEAGEQVIIGSRDLKESNIQKHQPRWKELMGDAGNLLIQFMMGLRGLEDTQCGFKMLSEKVVLDVVPQMQVDRWGGDFEMLMLARKMGYHIVEIPVVWEDAGLSLVGASGYANTLKELFQVKWRMIMGKYKYKK